MFSEVQRQGRRPEAEREARRDSVFDGLQVQIDRLEDIVTGVAEVARGIAVVAGITAAKLDRLLDASEGNRPS